MSEKLNNSAKPSTVKEPGAKKSAGFSVYIGPSIRGLVDSSHIYKGSPAEAAKLPELRIVLAQRPKLRGLVVDGADLIKAQAEIKKPGTELFKLNRLIARGEDVKEEKANGR